MCAEIVAFHPDIVITEKGVSGRWVPGWVPGSCLFAGGCLPAKSVDRAVGRRWSLRWWNGVLGSWVAWAPGWLLLVDWRNASGGLLPAKSVDRVGGVGGWLAPCLFAGGMECRDRGCVLTAPALLDRLIVWLACALSDTHPHHGAKPPLFTRTIHTHTQHTHTHTHTRPQPQQQTWRSTTCSRRASRPSDASARATTTASPGMSV